MTNLAFIPIVLATLFVTIVIAWAIFEKFTYFDVDWMVKFLIMPLVILIVFADAIALRVTPYPFKLNEEGINTYRAEIIENLNSTDEALYTKAVEEATLVNKCIEEARRMNGVPIVGWGYLDYLADTEFIPIPERTSQNSESTIVEMPSP